MISSLVKALPKPKPRKVWRAERPRSGPGYARVRVARGRALLQTRKWWESPKWRTTDGFWPGLLADFNTNRYAMAALGVELVTNGTFSDGTTGWASAAAPSDATLSVVDGALRVVAVGTGFPQAQQPIVTEVGKTYRFAGRLRKVSGASNASAAIKWTATSGNHVVVPAVSSGTFTAFELYFTATTVQSIVALFINASPATVGDTVEYDNISVREVLLGDVGPELITNGDFASGTGWTLNQPGTSTATISGGLLNLTGDGTNAASADQSFLTEVGASYTLVLYSGTASTDVKIGTTQDGIQIAFVATTLNAWNVFSFVATTTTTWIRFARVTASLATVDNVSIRKWVTRPTLRSATFSEMFNFASTGTTARTYINDAGNMLNDLAANAPRFTWQNGKRQLVLENEATNYCTYSQCRRAQVAIVTNGEIFDVPGCLGLLGGRFAEWNGTGSHGVQPPINHTTTLSAQYLWSIYVRPINTNYVQLTFLSAGFGTGQYANFELTGAGASAATGSNATIVALPAPWTGWYRISIRAPATVGGVALAACGQISAVTSLAAPRVESYTGTNLRSMFDMCGSDFRKDQTFVDSHIPTAGTTVNRPIETCQFSPLALAVMRQAAGTTVARGFMQQNNSASNPRVVGYDGAAALATFRKDTGQNVFYNGVNAVSGPTAVATNPYGVATSYDSAGTLVTSNGQTPTSGAYTRGTNTVYYLARSGTVAALIPYGDGFYDNMAVYPVRVTSASLQALAVAA